MPLKPREAVKVEVSRVPESAVCRQAGSIETCYSGAGYFWVLVRAADGMLLTFRYRRMRGPRGRFVCDPSDEVGHTAMLRAATEADCKKSIDWLVDAMSLGGESYKP